MLAIAPTETNATTAQNIPELPIQNIPTFIITEPVTTDQPANTAQASDTAQALDTAQASDTVQPSDTAQPSDCLLYTSDAADE